MPSNDAQRNLLPNRAIESFWESMWLGIQPFLCFIVKSRRIARRCLQTMRSAICCRMNRSRASGTPCGSVFRRFCVSIGKSSRIVIWRSQTIENWICYRLLPWRSSGTPCGSVFSRFCDSMEKSSGTSHVRYVTWLKIGDLLVPSKHLKWDPTCPKLVPNWSKIGAKLVQFSLK